MYVIFLSENLNGRRHIVLRLDVCENITLEYVLMMLYVFFWVIFRRLNFISRMF
jgi:hypothetical protein